MKLLLCEECHDIVALKRNQRECACGKSWGRYLNSLRVEVGGKALVIGLDNFQLARVLDLRQLYPDDNLTIAAWIMGDRTPNVEHLKKHTNT